MREVTRLDSVSPASPGLECFILVVLTVVAVVGLAVHVGFWQDDVSLVSHGLQRLQDPTFPGRGAGALPSRVLGRYLGMAAVASGHPLELFRLINTVSWLACGWLAARIGHLITGSSLTGYLAGVLTVSATSDFLSASTVGVGYTLSLAFFLGALASTLSWQRDGRALQIAWSCLWLSLSVWLSEIAVVPTLLFPAFLALAGSWTLGRRSWIAVGAWFATAMPYLIGLVWSLKHAPYAKFALRTLDGSWLVRSFELLAFNFTPWRWIEPRSAWHGRPAPAVPVVYYWTAAALCTALALWGLVRYYRRVEVGENAVAPRAWLPGAALLLVCTALTNAQFAAVKASEFHYRTHLGSRVWASLLIALCSAALSRTAGGRWLAGVLLATFVGLGVAGGIERQDFFATSWRRHRTELRSIVAAVPGLEPEAKLVLWVPKIDGFMATTADYLVRSWLSLLYEDAALKPRLYLWSPMGGTECDSQPAGLVCSAPGSDAAAALPQVFPWQTLVVLRYEEADGRFRLLTSPPPSRDGSSTLGSVAYHPLDQIQARRSLPLRERLLPEDSALVTWLLPSPP